MEMHKTTVGRRTERHPTGNVQMEPRQQWLLLSGLAHSVRPLPCPSISCRRRSYAAVKAQCSDGRRSSPRWTTLVPEADTHQKSLDWRLGVEMKGERRKTNPVCQHCQHAALLLVQGLLAVRGPVLLLPACRFYNHQERESAARQCRLIFGKGRIRQYGSLLTL